jgi:hypothetical protein
VAEETGNEEERRARRERELSEHDRVAARNAAHASRDTLHDASAWQEPGAYTTEQARDRAAHTPSILERLDRPRNPQEEERMLDALHQELFPTDEARAVYDRQTASPYPAQDKDDRQQWQDLREMDGSGQPDAAKGSNDVTPEQQANVDKALAKADITDKITGGTDVSGRPVPNDPAEKDRAVDIGHDLHKQGVIMEK